MLRRPPPNRPSPGPRTYSAARTVMITDTMYGRPSAAVSTHTTATIRIPMSKWIMVEPHFLDRRSLRLLGHERQDPRRPARLCFEWLLARPPGLTGEVMTITTQEIPRQAWRSYFDELTEVLGTVEATVEVVGRDLGDQFADARQILTDITYDDHDDAIIVGLEAPDSEVERIEYVIEQ